MWPRVVMFCVRHVTPLLTISAFILSVIGLVRLWNVPPFRWLWWSILLCQIAIVLFSGAGRESLRMYGMRDWVSVAYGILVTLLHIALLVLGIRALCVQT